MFHNALISPIAHIDLFLDTTLPEGKALSLHAPVSIEGREDWWWRSSWVSLLDHRQHKFRQRLVLWADFWGKGHWGGQLQFYRFAVLFSEVNWSVWWPTNRVTVLVANWTLYFQTEFKTHLTGCRIKDLHVWDRTNWMQFTSLSSSCHSLWRGPKYLLLVLGDEMASRK